MKCKYILPCGRCEKTNTFCDSTQSHSEKECDHDWKCVGEYFNLESFTGGERYICSKCNATKYVE